MPRKRCDGNRKVVHDVVRLMYRGHRFQTRPERRYLPRSLLSQARARASQAQYKIIQLCSASKSQTEAIIV